VNARRRSVIAAAVILATVGALLAGQEAYRRAKGILAGRLIDRACDQWLVDGIPRRPWAWADMRPIARLEVPRLGVRQAILEGATGGTLAFGLGHVSGTAAPGGHGTCAIAGHRDRWGAFLGDLLPGDEVILRTPGGTSRYRVSGASIVPADAAEVLDPGPVDRLALVTCYPFGGLLRSRWRYVVSCVASAPTLTLASSRRDSVS
jgi:sortase A